MSTHICKDKGRRLEQPLMFREEQRFRSLWIWAVILPVAVGLPLHLVYGIVQQLVHNAPWGNKPLSDTALVAVGSGFTAFGVLLIILFVKMRLITEVRSNGLYIRFIPFHRGFLSIDLPEVVECRALSYRPVLEYGGWGIRYRWKGKGYNVSGNRGVRLDFRNGHHILIGSRRAQELADCINTILENGQHEGQQE